MNQILTLAMAKAVAAAASEHAHKKKISIVISIFDVHGNLKYFERMDNTSYGSIRVSQLKAKTSASFPVSSKALSDRNASIPTHPYSSIPDILTLGGGVPLFNREKIHLGSIVISGATPEIDEECALAGAEAIFNI